MAIWVSVVLEKYIEVLPTSDTPAMSWFVYLHFSNIFLFQIVAQSAVDKLLLTFKLYIIRPFLMGLSGAFGVSVGMVVLFDC